MNIIYFKNIIKTYYYLNQLFFLEIDNLSKLVIAICLSYFIYEIINNTYFNYVNLSNVNS